MMHGATASAPDEIAPHFQYPPHRLSWKVESTTGFVVPVINPLEPVVPLVGRLLVHVKRGRNLHRTHLLSDKMDPYVECKVGQTKVRTAICSSGGVNPSWDETMKFDLNGDDQAIRIKVFNKNRIADDVIGVARIPLNYLIMLSGHPGSQDGSMSIDGLLAGGDEMAANAAGRASVAVHSPGAAVVAGRGRPAELAESTARLRNLVAGNSKLSEAKRTLLLSIIDAKEADLPIDPRRHTGRRDAWFTLGRDSKATSSAGQIMLNFDFIPADGSGDFIPDDVPGAATVSLGAATSGGGGGGGLATPRASANHIIGGLAGVEGAASAAAPSGKAAAKARRNSEIGLANAKHATALFGGSLADGIKRGSADIPLVCLHTISHIVRAGLELSGLLTSGPSSEQAVRELREAYESDTPLALGDVHDAFALLSLYLRSLRDPVVPAKQQTAIMKARAETDVKKQLKQLGKAVASIPAANRLLFTHCVALIKRVAENATKNGSDVATCCRVFFPLLMRAGDGENASAEGEAALRAIVDGSSMVLPDAKSVEADWE